MAYPINPPADYHVLRHNLNTVRDPRNPRYLGSGLWLVVHERSEIQAAKSSWYFWAPPWRQDSVIVEPGLDWYVGPYRSMRAAVRALKHFVDHEGDGPEVRAW